MPPFTLSRVERSLQQQSIDHCRRCLDRVSSRWLSARYFRYLLHAVLLPAVPPSVLELCLARPLCSEIPMFGCDDDTHARSPSPFPLCPAPTSAFVSVRVDFLVPQQHYADSGGPGPVRHVPGVLRALLPTNIRRGQEDQGQLTCCSLLALLPGCRTFFFRCRVIKLTISQSPEQIHCLQLCVSQWRVC